MADARVRALAVVIALLLGLGAIGVATVDERVGPSRVGLNASEPGEHGANGQVPTDSPPGSSPGESTAPGAPPADATGEAPLRGIVTPKHGTYRFKQTTKNRSEFSTTTFVNEKTEEVERRIERVSASADEIVDRRHTPTHVTSTGEDGSKSESRSYEERVWRRDGLYLMREVNHSTNTAPDGTKTEEENECDWEPDRVQLVFPLGVGREWSWNSSCSGAQDDGEATTTNNGHAKVTGVRDFNIGGRAVGTYVIELTATEDTSGRLGEDRDTTFTVHSEQRTISFFAPVYGLSVRVESEQTNDVTFEGQQGGPQNSKTMQTSTAELLSVEPA